MSDSSCWSDIRSNIDWVMVFCALALFGLGCATVYSASPIIKGVSSFTMRQLVWGGISALAYVAILRIGYKHLLTISVPFYVVTVFLFVLLIIVGHATKGAQSWFSLGFARFQPSELGKVAFALVLSHLCVRIPPNTAKGFFIVLGLSCFTTGLIMLQPDLGSALVYFVIMFAILLAAGTPFKFLAGMIFSCAASLPLLWMMLKPYQKMRLFVFFDPWIDPQGAGYNVIQSRIAVGSGGLFGKGFLRGTQGKLHFLPEPHTDFIFSVFSEEFGFAGSAVVLLLFAILLWRIISVAKYTRDMRAKLLSVGIAAWIWFQMTESVAMSMGLAPVTGLPLPLFSYGGSSLLSVMIALAIVQSIAIMSREGRF